MSSKKLSRERWLINSINSLNAVYNGDPPVAGTLYHYTDFAGLQGILETHTLWATYNRVLNDASEQVYAEEILRKEFGGEEIFLNKNFVTCFCESDKLLSMWRAYAGNCGGYCLGFEYARLRKICWSEPSAGDKYPLLARVHYGKIPEQIRTYLTVVCKSTSSDRLLRCSPFFPSMIKHEAFAEECEWRTIGLDPPLKLMKFRSGSANIRPYVELSLRESSKPKLPLVSVTFGPTLRREDRPEEIIGWMLEKNGYGNVPVKPSDIPFRL